VEISAVRVSDRVVGRDRNPKTVTVAVVIPCRNEAARIADLLTSLRDQSRRPDTTVIVDDQSTGHDL
jgi:GT2 family glycosyltransferase